MQGVTDPTEHAFRRHYADVYRFVRRRTQSDADAEDLAQQTLLKAYRSWSRVKGADSPHAYLRTMLTNTFLSARRPKGRRLELLTDEPPEPAAPAAPAGERGPEDRMVLWPHVKSLPPRQRAVIVLRYYEDLTEQEIADVLGCSRGTVKSTAHRGLKALRAVLGPDQTEGEEDPR